MRSITLNLLVEEQLALKAEARDPFKVTIAIGISLVTIAVIIGTLLAGTSAKRKGEADALQSKYDALAVTESIVNSNDIKTLKALSDEFVTVNQSRLLFASQLALIKDLVPETVQLTTFHFSIVTETPVVPRGDDEEGKPRPKPKPVDHLNLQMDGRAVCPRPEIEVDEFLTTLRTNAVFSALIADIHLRSIARAGGSSDPNAVSVPAASFVIDCQYKERK